MITLDDRSRLVPLLKSLQIALSEFSFANLFLFRKKHQYQLVNFENDFFVSGKTYDGISTLMPTSVPNPIQIKKLIDQGVTFYPIPEQWLRLFPSEVLIENHIEDNDYLFHRDKIANYSGRVLSAKRNLVSQFERDYTATMAPITKDSKSDAFQVLEKWIKHSEIGDDDRNECHEAIKYFNELSLTGLLFYVDNQPIAFLIGEELQNDTYIIHFAKGLKEYKGVYPYVYQQFARQLPEYIFWLNFEQDLGIPNLRQAKHSFHPDAYGYKYRVTGKTRP